MAILRAFIAIELEEGIKAALQSIQQRCQRLPAGRLVRWVAPEGIHLTLKFLGDVDSVRVPNLLMAMQQAGAGIQPFGLVVQGAGCFPNPNRPNVVWVGLGGEVQAAIELAHRLEDECATLGFAREERPFSPHLTLGRVRKEVEPPERRQVGLMVQQLDPGVIGMFKATELYLMRSELRPTGAVYSSLGSVQLM